MAILLDGKKVRDEIAKTLREKIAAFSSTPKLVIIQVGEVKESSAYIQQKKVFGESIGALVEHMQFPDSVSERELVSRIAELNTTSAVHGIIVQLPIPEHLNREKIINVIAPEKDVDGLTQTNVALLASGKEGGLIPATARGIVSLLRFYGVTIRGKNIAVLGRSALVGRPAAFLLKHEGGRVTICHSQTPNTREITKKNDIIVVAIGKPRYITREFVSAGQVVVDVGINSVRGEKFEEELPQRKIVGDVDFDAVKDVVAAISSVPGGVGPMTVASLFQNLVEAYEKQIS